MTEPQNPLPAIIHVGPSTRLRATASQYQCDNCPPDRVCAWACVQGAGMEEIVIGAALAIEGVPGGPYADPAVEPTRDALWDSFN
jgi:hypothetical protein